MGLGNFLGKDYKSDLDESYGEGKQNTLLPDFQILKDL